MLRPTEYGYSAVTEAVDNKNHQKLYHGQNSNAMRFINKMIKILLYHSFRSTTGTDPRKDIIIVSIKTVNTLTGLLKSETCI